MAVRTPHVHQLFMFSEPAGAGAVRTIRATAPGEVRIRVEVPELVPEPVPKPAPLPALHMLACNWDLYTSCAGGTWVKPRLQWTITCVEQLLYVCDNLLAVPGADYYLFRAGIDSTYDTEPNASGGKARIAYTSKEDTPVFWLRARDALLDLVSGELDARLAALGLQEAPGTLPGTEAGSAPLITGLALTTRGSGRTLSFWTRNLETHRPTFLGALEEFAAAHRAEYACGARAPAPAPSEKPMSETDACRAAALAAAATCKRTYEWAPHRKRK